MNEPTLKAALGVRYALPEWAIYYNVANGTGSNQRRWADAVAFNCYPSRGLSIFGFEIKTARADWLRELADPDKSVPVQQFCDKWFVVATPDIVRQGELPSTWGLIEYKGSKLFTKVDAPELKPIPVTRQFMVAVLRNAAQSDDAAIRIKIDAALKAERERQSALIESKIKERSHRYDNVLGKLDKIKELTGIDLTEWSPVEPIATAVKFALNADLGSRYSAIGRLEKTLTEARTQIQHGLAEAGIEFMGRDDG